MDTGALTALLNGDDLEINVKAPGAVWARYEYQSDAGSKTAVTGLNYVFEGAGNEIGEYLHVFVYVGYTPEVSEDGGEYLGRITIDKHRSITTAYCIPTRIDSTPSAGDVTMHFNVPFGLEDIPLAFGGSPSDYEIEIYVLDCGEKLTVGRKRLENVSGGEEIKGDVNGSGEVTLDDAIDVLKISMKVGGAGEFNEAADISGDGSITLDDAIAVLKIAMSVAG